MNATRPCNPATWRRIQRVLLLVLLASVLAACSAPDPYALSKPGPFQVGYQNMSFIDPDRGGRRVDMTIWYPARIPRGTDASQAVLDAVPDTSKAPYPVLLSATKTAARFARHLVSRGYVWVSVDDLDFWSVYDESMIKQPLDLIAALDRMAVSPPKSLEGMADTDRAGALGYSFDGYNALALSGARIDPAFYLEQCADPSRIDEALQGGVENWGYCALADRWDAFAACAGPEITDTTDGLWKPLTDPRILAVMPMACDGWLLFGERGLACVDRPVFMAVAREDFVYEEAALIYEHLGTDDRSLVTFRSLDHMMILDELQVARLAHFAAAFFGEYLQKRDDYRRFYSEEFIRQREELCWGVCR